MRFLFIHKYLPGQFESLIRHLLDEPGHEVIGICQEYAPQWHTLLGFKVIRYRPEPLAGPYLNPCLSVCAEDIGHGLAVAEVLTQLQARGLTPDLIFAHLGWGEPSYCKDVYPAVPLIGYCEFYYHPRGVDADFDPAFPLTRHDEYRIRSANAIKLLGLAGMDAGISPTRWQQSLFPPGFQSRIRVIHEGLDLTRLRPDAEAEFRLPNGRVVNRQTPVVTYATRNLEPYRGLRSLVRAAAAICERRRDCQIVIAGGDDVAYSAPARGETHLERVLRETPLDPERVHFTGRLSNGEYLKLLQVSAAHIYLTVPFVLSWSMLEAMACGCVVIGSDTPPVREVLQHEHNGLLVDFFSPGDIAAMVDRVLDHPTREHALGLRAREDMHRHYGVAQSLRGYRELIGSVLAGEAHHA